MNPEEKIKEKRTIEAIKKKYMGRSGKFGIILRYMGEEIYTQSSPLHEVNYMEDPWAVEAEEEMEYFDEGATSTSIGWTYQAYNLGMHLEFKYMQGKLTVHYKGFPVYVEQYGELFCFVPIKEWEDKVEQLYKIASAREQKERKELKLEKKIIAERQKQGFIRKLAKLWGI
jgi:hypothetical protein